MTLFGVGGARFKQKLLNNNAFEIDLKRRKVYMKSKIEEYSSISVRFNR